MTSGFALTCPFPPPEDIEHAAAGGTAPRGGRPARTLGRSALRGPRGGVLAICSLALAGLALDGCRGGATRRAAVPAHPSAARGELAERHDQPDEAEMYYRAKRRPLDPSTNPVAAYERAERQRLAMPRHSLVLDATFEPAARAQGAAREAAALPAWQPLGPGNIGGRMRGFVINPSSPDVMYVSGVSGGVWKTSDGGVSWATATDQLANVAFNSLAMNPANPDVLYGGTGEGYFREEVRGTGLPLRGAGIFVSRDAGATWSRLASTESEDFYWVNDLVISRLDPARIYAATRTGVWRSLDEGLTWTRVLATSAKGGCLDLAMRSDTSSDFIFASCGTLDQATVYRCRAAEGAAAWEGVLSEPWMGRTTLAIAPSNQRVVYALSASNAPSATNPYGQGLFAVFRSTAEGASGSWSARVRNTNTNPMNNLLLTNPIAANYVRCQWDDQDEYVNMGWYCNVIAVDPLDPDIVWAAGVDLFRSNDGGRNWGVASYWWANPQQASFVHADQHNIVFHPAFDGTLNQTMFAACDGGVYRTDGARWPVAGAAQDLCDASRSSVRFYSLNHGLGVTQFYHGAVFPGATRYLGGTQDNGTVLGADISGPDRWRMIYGGDGGYVAIDPRDPSVVYVQSQYFDLQKSTDGGTNFVPSRRGIPDRESFLFVAPLAMDPNDPGRLWTGGQQLWRSPDGAGSWVPASASFDGISQASAVAVAPGRSERVVVGTNSGTILVSDSAWSTNGATAWERNDPRAGFVTWVAFDPSDPDVVYATYGGFGGAHLYRSRDGGRSFESVGSEGPSPIPDVPVHCVLADPGRSSRLFLGTDVGVFVSEDGGESWEVENTGFATAVTECLTVGTGDDGSRYLFAFTHGRGAWRVKLPAAPPGQSRHVRRHLTPA
ncbi:MAG TPA: hypothetical protein VMT19_13395 [Thermoanaerobaculaceae bacterium]|nr:hypothetical protein [Thermoanaerobaculaceae bacterium]